MQQPVEGKGLKIFRIIAFSIAVLAVICAMAMGIYLCVTERRANKHFG